VGVGRTVNLVLHHLVDPVDHTRDVTEQLKQKSPEHLNARTFLDQYGQERQDQSQEDEEHFDHALTLRQQDQIAPDRVVRINSPMRHTYGAPVGSLAGFGPPP
jgi:hypothetical protein